MNVNGAGELSVPILTVRFAALPTTSIIKYSAPTLEACRAADGTVTYVAV